MSEVSIKLRGAAAALLRMSQAASALASASTIGDSNSCGSGKKSPSVMEAGRTRKRLSSTGEKKK